MAGEPTRSTADRQNDPYVYPSPALAIRHIRACLDTGNEVIAGQVVNKLIDPPNISPAVTANRASSMLLPVISQLEGLIGLGVKNCPSIPDLERLYRTAIKLRAANMAKHPPTKIDFDSMLQAIVMSCEHGLLQTEWVVRLNFTC